MKLVVTIDTEEDQWGQFDCPEYTVSNARRLPDFQELCEHFGVRPTYLVSYEMARQESSAILLRDLAGRPGVEIGAHCHPWNTPPLEPAGQRTSMLCNLSPEAQRAKLVTLTECLERVFGQQPRSFRAGRWGFHGALTPVLQELGYWIDSSITPFMSWRDQGGPDYSRAYPEQFWLSQGDSEARLLEIPTTVGFLQNNAQRANRLLSTILGSSLLRRLHTYGILSRLGLLNRIWICPEMTSLGEMIALTRRLERRGISVVNLMFHSVTLAPGLSPFVTSEREAAAFLARLRGYFAFTRDHGLEPVRLCDLYPHAHADLPVGTS